jgi:hypothetical protein
MSGKEEMAEAIRRLDSQAEDLTPQEYVAAAKNILSRTSSFVLLTPEERERRLAEASPTTQPPSSESGMEE